MCQGLAIITVIILLIHIVKGYTLQKSESIFSNLFCGPVIDAEFSGPAAHIDAALGKNRSVAVDSLVGISHDKDIVPVLFTCKRPNQTVSTGAEILPLVHDDILISSHRELFLQNDAALIHCILGIPEFALVTQAHVFFKYPPYLHTLHAVKTKPPADAGSLDVLLFCIGLLCLDHLNPFIDIEILCIIQRSARPGNGIIPNLIQFLSIGNTILVPLLTKEGSHPRIQVDDFYLLHLIHNRNLSKIFPNIIPQVFGKSSKKYTLFRRKLCRQPLCSVHGHHSLSRTGSAENFCRACIVSVDDSSLCGMQENSPFFKGLCHDSLQFLFSVYYYEALPAGI